ncbi:MAG: Crp/Fnr family transcriptional regulator [Chloroflexi bacterium]|jgi:CRP/FNR family transcriptional regulator, cyclic AMP receptor protein|nr:Crp/Fnr family transcriptional regulator [Chloroflexota bacterium]
MLTISEKVEFLNGVSAFNELLPEQFQSLANICEEKFYNAGERIFSQGEADGALFIVVSGKVLLERETDDANKSVSMNTVGTRGYFGEISLFYDAPWSVSATAMQSTKVLKLINDDFAVFVTGQPRLLVKMNTVLSQRLVEAHDKISEITRNRKPRELQKLYDGLNF